MTASSEPPRPGRPSFSRSAFLTYGTNLGVAALSLLSVLIISRALGPAGRGDVTFLITISLLTSSLSSLGIHQASANYAGLEPRLRPSLATNAVLFSLGLGTLAAGIVALLIAVFPAVGGGESTALRWLALGSIPIMIIRNYFGMLVQSDYAFNVANVAWLVGPVTNVAVNGAMAIAGALTVGSAVATWVGGQVLGVTILGWYLGRRLAGFGRPDLRLAVRSLRFGLKAHIGNVMLVGNYRLDQWLLGAISGSRELGLYSVAVAWGETLFFLPTALAAVLRPDAVRASPEEASRRVSTVFRAALILTIPLAVVIVVAAPFLCVTIFGEEFRGAIDDLRWLVPGAFGILTLKLLGMTLTSQGKPLLETIAIGVGFVSTIVLDAVLIPRFGGVGAAIASSIAYTAGGVVVVVIFVRALGGRVGTLVPRANEAPHLWAGMRQALRKPTGD